MKRLRFPLLLLFLLFLTGNLSASTFKRLLIKESHKIKIEIVESAAEKTLGLGKRDFLEKDTGMLFLYLQPAEQLFWMKNMNFEIDIIWILKDRVVHIEKNVPPPSLMLNDEDLKIYGRGISADKVLEVRGGLSEQIKLKPGDPIRLLD
ncbi:MAG: DUF192 domain-containing protein [Deltaproteobacteria bacterium]|nr:DUF192 domain-containing protein [Deltaproteobacteria bacterium]